MTLTFLIAVFGLLHVLLQLVFLLRALLRPHRAPSTRIAWLLVILAVPAVGITAYVLLGENRISQNRAKRYRALARPVADAAPGSIATVRDWPVRGRHRHLFRAGASVSGFAPVAGNKAQLLSDSDAAIDAIVADMDAATDHIHLLFYIWLDDGNGLKVARAAMRAARRGVTVRGMADALGSRLLIRSRHWQDMLDAGVKLAPALPINNPLLQILQGRIDLRNHRKIVVIDNRVTYCGSQNCADPEFRIKAKYAPWVDIMVRFDGPVARQNQALFAQDWMAHVDEDLTDLLDTETEPGPTTGVIAQAFGTGPTSRASAMPEMFETLIHAARSELVLTTPYYVPTEAMQAALCAAARRGVDTRIVFPARNDSFVVAAASRSYYQDLLRAGVRIFEFTGGLLHSKSLTADGEIALIGSANLDRRSFELNFENNILVQDRALTGQLRQRQDDYIAGSAEVSASQVAAWPVRRRLWNNTIAIMGPIL